MKYEDYNTGIEFSLHSHGLGIRKRYYFGDKRDCEFTIITENDVPSLLKAIKERFGEQIMSDHFVDEPTVTVAPTDYRTETDFLPLPRGKGTGGLRIQIVKRYISAGREFDSDCVSIEERDVHRLLIAIRETFGEQVLMGLY